MGSFFRLQKISAFCVEINLVVAPYKITKICLVTNVDKFLSQTSIHLQG
jgi:hypothetical protein